jgi:Tol biopolymer transport system component
MIENPLPMKIIKLLSLIFLAASFNGCDDSLISNINNCAEGDFVSPKTDSKIIFISRRIQNSADWNLIIMNPDGSNQTKLTNLTVDYGKVVVSHSGRTVLFVHYSSENFYELYSINIDGTSQTLIDRAKRHISSPDWSEDDSKIIYSRSRNESTDERDLVLFDVSTKNKQTLTDSGNNLMGRFSKDNKIAFWRQDNISNNIFLMDIDGSNKQIIIPDASYPVWSPGGKRIAYISKGELNSPQIFIACSDGTNSRQLTSSYLRSWDSGFPNFGNGSPQWTPDGEKIVYESYINDGMPGIYIMNSDGSNQTILTSTVRRNEDPVISSDGNYILFTSNRDLSYNFDIFVMEIDGKNQTAISKYAGDDSLPVIVSK